MRDFRNHSIDDLWSALRAAKTTAEREEIVAELKNRASW